MYVALLTPVLLLPVTPRSGHGHGSASESPVVPTDQVTSTTDSLPVSLKAPT
jgi:hypothetical protein